MADAVEPMPLYLRLSLAVWGLLVAAVVAITIMMLIAAGPRIRAESEAVMRLTQDFLLSSLEPDLGPVGSERLKRQVARLSQVRHVAITLHMGDGQGLIEPPPATGWTRWMTAFGWQDPDSIELPLKLTDGGKATILISPRTSDEFDEVAEAVSSILLAELTLAIAVMIMTSMLLARGLRPLSTLGDALLRLEAGDYSVTVPQQPQAEFDQIVRRINRLSGTLRQARSDNLRLSRKLVEYQDAERREIAGELHDELGPYLFSVRARVTTLRREAERQPPDPERLKSLTATILDQIEALQDANRRVLRKLAPIGLRELGVLTAINGLVSTWRAEHPETLLEVVSTDDLKWLGPTHALTVYRVVQEGVTNAFRHAAPSRIEIELKLIAQETGAERKGGGDAPRLEIVVRDNGRGAGNAVPVEGFGLTNMRERIEALGGALELRIGPGPGSELFAFLPLGTDAE